MKNVQVSTHPIIQDRLTRLRDKNTSSQDFRKYLSEIALILGVQATATLVLDNYQVETPLAPFEGKKLQSSAPLIVPILRAGLALSEGLSRLIPHADTGYIGLYRDEESHKPVEYLVRLPKALDRPIYVVDPMLATGHSMVKTLNILQNHGAVLSNITIITLLCAPEGIKELQTHYPSVPIHTAAIDSHLNENAFIVPGLGDAGDRYFGT